jgi:quercetin dioxygenase-like cupin family protein
VLVVDGSVRVETGGETFEAQAGTLFTFEPDERRSVSSEEGARILLFLAPWPGAGHYRGDEKAAQPAS